MARDSTSARGGDQEVKGIWSFGHLVIWSFGHLDGIRLALRAGMTKKQQHALTAAAAAVVGGALVARGIRAARRIDFRGRSVVITGGSRGLGLLVARQLAAEGARLTLAARDQAELDRAREDLLAGGASPSDVNVIACDIGKRADAQGLIARVLERDGTVDVLINNAGIMKVGPIDHMQPADFEEAMAVHFQGPLHTTLAAIPAMRRQGGGRIVNVSSIGGKIGVPHMAPYCASKFALTGLSESLRAELAGDGILVTAVHPGLMRTGSPFNAWFKGRHREEFTWFIISDSIPVASIDGRRAAAQLIDACRHGDAELVITLPAKLAIVANALAPRSVALVMQLANRFVLPAPLEEGGDHARSGWQSLSNWAPSRLTRLTEAAAAANNELPH
jgi:NAD(P)-dependent dehydrogenase (short-subunit alcohol dehydrogenase family)